MRNFAAIWILLAFAGCAKNESEATKEAPATSATPTANESAPAPAVASVPVPAALNSAVPTRVDAGGSLGSAPGALVIEADLSGPCDQARGFKPHTPAVTTAINAGVLSVVVRDVGDYCVTDAKYHAVRQADGIHIVKEKPTAVSRCVCVRDVTFTLKGVEKGSYAIVYEEIPYASDAGIKKIAAGSVVVP